MRKNTSVLDYKKIGYRVRAARREESLSQEVLAERCSTTSRYLSDIENGKCNPSLDMLVRISAALNVSVDSFLYDSPTPFTGYLLKNAIPQKVNQLSKQNLLFLDRMLDLMLENQSVSNVEAVKGFEII